MSRATGPPTTLSAATSGLLARTGCGWPDITYVPTAAGFLFLAVVLDAWSRRIVGWAMAKDLRTRLVLDALDMAVTTRKPVDVVHHSDQGSQAGFNQSSQRLCAPPASLFSNTDGGWEFPAFWAVAMVVQSLLGDGAFALGRRRA